MFGHSFATTGSTAETRRLLREEPVLLFGGALLLAILVYWAAHLVFVWFDRAVAGAAGAPHGHYFSRKLWLTVVALLIPWSAWWVIHYPGALDDDTIYQLLQSSGFRPWSNHHPVFDTWLFGRFWALGDLLGSKSTGLAVFTGLNMVATALATGAAIHYTRWLGAPRVMVRLLTASLALIPIIPMFAMSMTKDYLFGWIYLLLTLCFIECVRTRGHAVRNRGFALLMFSTALLSMLTKQTGLYCLLAAVAALLPWCCHNRLRVTGVLVTPLILFLLFSHLALPALGVQRTKTSEMLSIPLQQTARYVVMYPDEVTAEEREAIEAVLPYEQLDELYKPHRSDAVKDNWLAGDDLAAMKAYFRVWFAMGLKHPLAYAVATFNNTYPLFYPQPMDDLYDQVSPSFFTPERIDYWYAISEHDSVTRQDIEQELSGIEAAPGMTTVRGIVNNAYHGVRHSLVGVILLSGATYCFWIPLLAACYLVRTRRTHVLLALVPYMVFFLTLVAGPIVLPRYLSTTVYLLPTMVALPFAAYRRATPPVEGSGAQDEG
ncbi:DUF6020 family protein [Propionibacterium australiense]|uniref:DUF6020 family protein n=1 Tax=Propionibacterium australiense TaxID=119981 RepID=UPI000F82A97C|nr:DUF6020 family protein [Propionibacterium australiense]